MSQGAMGTTREPMLYEKNSDCDCLAVGPSQCLVKQHRDAYAYNNQPQTLPYASYIMGANAPTLGDKFLMTNIQIPGDSIGEQVSAAIKKEVDDIETRHKFGKLNGTCVYCGLSRSKFIFWSREGEFCQVRFMETMKPKMTTKFSVGATPTQTPEPAKPKPLKIFTGRKMR